VPFDLNLIFVIIVVVGKQLDPLTALNWPQRAKYPSMRALFFVPAQPLGMTFLLTMLFNGTRQLRQHLRSAAECVSGRSGTFTVPALPPGAPLRHHQARGVASTRHLAPLIENSSSLKHQHEFRVAFHKCNKQC